MSENTIMRVKFGSHLYGTNTPESDTDYKSVHIPCGYDIVMGRVRGVNSKSTGNCITKNTKDDIDDESFSLGKFFDMIRTGDMIAYELLFVPNTLLEIKSDNWDYIKQNRMRLVNRNVKGFIGYIRQQVNKYGIKGSRIATARAAMELFDFYRGSSTIKRIGDIPKDKIQKLIEANEFIDIVYLTNSKVDPREYPYIEVLNRKIDFRTSVNDAYKITSKIFYEYGSRALAAENNEGVDWKSVYHAIRVSEQALELVNTGIITFPRQNVDDLLKIRRGEYKFMEIAERLENNLVQLEKDVLTCKLMENTDSALMDEIQYNNYLTAVINYEGRMI